jgi:heme-degrading monooxygenase HmoA
MDLAQTPEPPYYAVIFTSRRNAHTGDGYDQTADRMFELAPSQPGYLGVDHARSEIGITVCYWTDLDAIAGWKAQVEHAEAQRQGRERWYDAYELRIARVERAYGFEREDS